MYLDAAAIPRNTLLNKKAKSIPPGQYTDPKSPMHSFFSRFDVQSRCCHQVCIPSQSKAWIDRLAFQCKNPEHIAAVINSAATPGQRRALAKARLEALKPLRMIVKQISQIRGRRMSGTDGQ